MSDNAIFMICVATVALTKILADAIVDYKHGLGKKDETT